LHPRSHIASGVVGNLHDARDGSTLRCALRSVLLAIVVALCASPVAARVWQNDADAVTLREAGVGDDLLPEYRIKAAFLYNFIRYTTWPKESFERKDQPIEILVVGKDPFGGVLEATFRDKTLHGRKVSFQRAEKVPKEISSHLVFCCGLSSARLAELLALCKGSPVLLVGDEEGLAERGTCASFYIDDNKVRFAINMEAAKRNRLAISSELLKLARIVKTGGAPQ
jgi:hypothetical protein